MNDNSPSIGLALGTREIVILIIILILAIIGLLTTIWWAVKGIVYLIRKK